MLNYLPLSFPTFSYEGNVSMKSVSHNKTSSNMCNWRGEHFVVRRENTGNLKIEFASGPCVIMLNGFGNMNGFDFLIVNNHTKL